MCRCGPPKIATLSLPEFENSRNHSEFNAEALGSGPRGRRFKSSRPDQIP
jgi:hypothetical protein